MRQIPTIHTVLKAFSLIMVTMYAFYRLNVLLNITVIESIENLWRIASDNMSGV